MLKAVVFDFDGVIVDSEPLHYAAFLEVVKPLGVEFSYAKYLRKYLGFDDRDGFRSMLAARSGIAPPADSPQIGALVVAKAEAFARVVARGIEPMPGAVELVADVAAAMPIAIASGAGRHDIELICRKLDIAHHFALIVSADDVAKSKPDPTSYRLAVEQLAALFPEHGIEPGACLAIEDTNEGLTSARDAGLMTLAVATTLPAAQLSRADRVVESLADVRVEDLRSWFDGLTAGRTASST